VQRPHKGWDLPLIRGARLPKSIRIRKAITAAGDSINLVVQRETTEASETAYASSNELVYANGRRNTCMIPVPDQISMLGLGWAVSVRTVTSLALEACEKGRNTLRHYSVNFERVAVHHNQSPVFTGYG
jgi:hypothetical protein